MSFSDITNQRIRRGDKYAAAQPEQKHQEDYAAKARRSGQGEERDRDKGQAEHKSQFLALAIKQWADAERSDDESERLRKRDRAVLAGRKAEAIGQVGHNRAQHGG